MSGRQCTSYAARLPWLILLLMVKQSARRCEVVPKHCLIVCSAELPHPASASLCFAYTRDTSVAAAHVMQTCSCDLAKRLLMHCKEADSLCTYTLPQVLDCLPDGRVCLLGTDRVTRSAETHAV